MSKSKILSPFLKWAGGKRQLLSEIKEQLPKTISRYQYIEPFIGGGAVLLSLQPKHAIINDFNAELINTYRVIKDAPDELIDDLKKHINEADYFYKLRNIDRDSEAFNRLTDVQRASRIIYLNKTCYNGLYRVNKSGEYNAPFGRYKNPSIVNEDVIRAISDYFNKNNIQILNGDFENVLAIADRKTFVYLDPPYYPISESANFTSYVQGGWKAEDQIRLRDACNQLTAKHTKFLLSNSDCPFIRELYSDYTIITVEATRAINSDADGRGKITELLIKNY